MNNCLILVDLQNDYFSGGMMELVGIQEAAVNAQVLLGAFRKANSLVVHIQHISTRPGSTFFLPETNGAEINKLVAPQGDEIVVVKNFPNSFRSTSLLEILRNNKINNLYICGAMSHMCIDATTRAAFDMGFNCTVAEDACATKDLNFNNQTVKALDVHYAFMAALSGAYAKVVATKEVIQNGV